MSNAKIIIEVRGGNVVSVSASKAIDIAIIDWDNINNGDAPIKDILEPDAIFDAGKAHELYADGGDSQQKKVSDYLKANHF